MVKKMFNTQLKYGRWSANFYYINNTADRKGIEWQEIYIASSDAMLPAPQPSTPPAPPTPTQPRRKRKQHPATTKIFAPPATRFEIKL